MGLDVYVGSLTRYYSQDWETVVQRAGREEGFHVEMVRPVETQDAVTDIEIIREAVVAWREQLSEALAASLKKRLDWQEDEDSPYFTDKPGWDCYSGILLWAAHEEHPELKRPGAWAEAWSTDEAFRRSSSPQSGTR